MKQSKRCFSKSELRDLLLAAGLSIITVAAIAITFAYAAGVLP